MTVLYFDDDGKVYLIYDGERLKIVRLNDDLTGIRQDVPERSSHRKRQRTNRKK